MYSNSSSNTAFPTLPRSSSSVVDPRRPPPSNTASSIVEFPSSPHSLVEEEIKVHHLANHPNHPLINVNLPDLFTCYGCKEFGAGKRFACQICDCQLHEFCALAPAVLKTHPFHFHHQLLFYSKPVKGAMVQSKCDICGKSMKGYNFDCSACSFKMHPCCAMLSTDMNFQKLHPHSLNLSVNNNNNAQMTDQGDPSINCGECKHKRSGRVYFCTVATCDYRLHAACAKNLINGLRDNGYKGIQKPSMIGTAARLASQMVIEFIGGLIEGLGEGIGEVFVQSISKGRSRSTRGK